MVTDEKARNETARSMITPALQRELLRHPGKWVAITRTRLVGMGDSAEAALQVARERGEPHPMLYRVRDSDTLYFF
jgi:hypothetical protein